MSDQETEITDAPETPSPETDAPEGEASFSDATRTSTNLGDVKWETDQSLAPGTTEGETYPPSPLPLSPASVDGRVKPEDNLPYRPIESHQDGAAAPLEPSGVVADVSDEDDPEVERDGVRIGDIVTYRLRHGSGIGKLRPAMVLGWHENGMAWLRVFTVHQEDNLQEPYTDTAYEGEGHGAFQR